MRKYYLMEFNLLLHRSTTLLFISWYCSLVDSCFNLVSARQINIIFPVMQFNAALFCPDFITETLIIVLCDGYTRATRVDQWCTRCGVSDGWVLAFGSKTSWASNLSAILYFCSFAHMVTKSIGYPVNVIIFLKVPFYALFTLPTFPNNNMCL